MAINRQGRRPTIKVDENKVPQLDIEFLTPPWEIPEEPTKPIKWEVALQPLRERPGSPARILVYPESYQANYRIRHAKARLWRADPYEKWRFNCYRIQDPDRPNLDGYGVWATYLGRRTEEEYEKERQDRASRSEGAKLGREKARLKRKIRGVEISQVPRR